MNFVRGIGITAIIISILIAIPCFHFGSVFILETFKKETPEYRLWEEGRANKMAELSQYFKTLSLDERINEINRIRAECLEQYGQHEGDVSNPFFNEICQEPFGLYFKVTILSDKAKLSKYPEAYRDFFVEKSIEFWKREPSPTKYQYPNKFYRVIGGIISAIIAYFIVNIIIIGLMRGIKAISLRF